MRSLSARGRIINFLASTHMNRAPTQCGTPGPTCRGQGGITRTDQCLLPFHPSFRQFAFCTHDGAHVRLIWRGVDHHMTLCPSPRQGEEIGLSGKLHTSVKFFTYSHLVPGRPNTGERSKRLVLSARTAGSRPATTSRCEQDLITRMSRVFHRLFRQSTGFSLCGWSEMGRVGFVGEVRLGGVVHLAQ